MRRRQNKYSEKLVDEHGEYYIGYTSSGNEFYIDEDDFDKIKEYCWYTSVTYGMLRIRARIGENKVLMHQILGFKYCDNIDRNELNNRKYNLRECTHQENCMNRSKYKNNTSGITGVYWIKKLQKWTARIQINGRSTNLGNFSDKTNAIKARLEAELKYYGDFAPQKHLFKDYGIEE